MVAITNCGFPQKKFMNCGGDLIVRTKEEENMQKRIAIGDREMGINLYTGATGKERRELWGSMSTLGIA